MNVKNDVLHPHVSFNHDECLNLEQALKKEWLDTDGLGGYASSTIINCHTRKYHGLYVIPIKGI